MNTPKTNKRGYKKPLDKPIAIPAKCEDCRFYCEIITRQEYHVRRVTPEKAKEGVFGCCLGYRNENNRCVSFGAKSASDSKPPTLIREWFF